MTTKPPLLLLTEAELSALADAANHMLAGDYEAEGLETSRKVLSGARFKIMAELAARAVAPETGKRWDIEATPIPADEHRYPFGCPDPDWCRGNRVCHWDCQGINRVPV